MAHNLVDRQLSQNETFSGVITLSDPPSIPEGGSVRTVNTDFDVGSVFTRQGLENPYYYENSAVGPFGGANVVSVDFGNTANWLNPTNVLVDGNVFATANIPAISTLNITSTQTVQISPTLFQTFVGFGSDVPAIGSEYTFSNVANDTFLNGQTLQSNSGYPYPGITPGPTSASFGAGSTTRNLAPDTGNASIGTYSTDGLDITDFSYSVDASKFIQGIEVRVNIPHTTLAPTYSVQLLKNGIPVGDIISKSPFKPTDTQLIFGGFNELFGSDWVYSDINNINFGVRLTGSESFSGILSAGYVTITVYLAPSESNFNFIGTYQDSFGDINTIALDSSGSIYEEDVVNLPNVLSPLFSGIPSNSFATAFNLDGRYYMAISDGKNGDFYPTQIISSAAGQAAWQDHISVEGPGVAPSFHGVLGTGNIIPLVTYNGNANVITFTANNSLSAGEVITFNITSGPTYINDMSFNVLGTGLSSTQFEISYHGASGSGNVSGNAIPQYTYPIDSIFQYPFWNLDQGYQTGLDSILWSSGPGSSNAGSVVTIYYLNAYTNPSGVDINLLNAWNNELYPVYVYVSGTNLPIANGTQLVTGIGIGTPPGGGDQRYYFTFNVPSIGLQQLAGGTNSQPGSYQLTIGTLTSTLALPGVSVGQNVTISNTSVPAWDQTFQILNDINSGIYSISQTSMDSMGLATYNWSYAGTTNVAPQNGQLVTVTGTVSSANPPNTYNVTDAVISNVSGIVSGTFTIYGFGTTNPETEVQSGAFAVTSGTQFQVDPGPLTFGNPSVSPIYGDSSNGFITLIGSSSLTLSEGIRQGTCFFITRNGYWSRPAPPVEFGTGADTNYVSVTNIPIGSDPDIIGRAIVLTEAGQNGQPGSSYYTIPEPVSFVYNNVNYVSSSFIIWDNTTTSVQLTFSDPVLIQANNQVDAPGKDLFALNTLSNSGWNTQYMGRSIYGRVDNKVQNFLGMTFGSYVNNLGSNPIPAGWILDPNSNPPNSLPTLKSSPILPGLSYYIKNSTGNTQPVLGMIYQSAFQDWENISILQNQTPYSARFVCRIPSNNTNGNFNIDFTSWTPESGFGKVYGSTTIPFSSLDSSMKLYTSEILSDNTLTIPSDLYLRVYTSNIDDTADFELDSIEIYPTVEPTNQTQLTVSYMNDLESFDGITGTIDTTTTNQQPVNGAATILNKLYILKESSMGYVDDTPNQEPADWNPYREISNVCGTCGINAYDVGEEWLVTACRNGLFAFNGGAPVQLELEIGDIWNTINWEYGHTIVVRNDVTNRRILVAVPMITPNQWCPNFEENTNPTQPNVIIYLNYSGIGSIEELINGMAMHVTIVGKIAVHDLKRKWSLWSIPTPYMAICKRNELDLAMLIGSGINNSKIYELGSYQSGQDDGEPFNSSYCTYGMVSQEKVQSAPGFGILNKRFAYFDSLISGNGVANITFFENNLNPNSSWSIPGGISLEPNPFSDIAGALDLYGQRLFCEISMDNGYFDLSKFTIVGNQDSWRPING